MNTTTKLATRRLAASLAIIIALATSSAWAATESYWESTSVGGSEASPYDIYDAANWSDGVGDGHHLNFDVSTLTYMTNTASITTFVGNDFRSNSGDFVFLGPLKFRCFKNTTNDASVSVLKKGDWTILGYQMYIGFAARSTMVFTNATGNVTVTGTSGNLYIADQEGSTGEVVKESGDWSFERSAYIGHGKDTTARFYNLGGDLASSQTVFIGDGKNSTARFYHRGGSLTAAEWGVCLGDNASGTTGSAYLEVSGGAVTNTAGNLSIGNGNSGGTAEVRVNGGEYCAQAGSVIVGSRGRGTLTIDSGRVIASASGVKFCSEAQCVAGRDSFLNLNGGTLETKTVTYGSGSANATFTFNGGKLKALQAGTLIASHNNLAVTVNAGGGTIDSGNNAITIAEDLGGTGAMRFKGGNTITLSGANTYTGGTTIELGTKVVASDETAKDTILSNLVVDGRAVLAETTYDVLECSGLTAAALENITLVNCGADTSVALDDEENPTKIIVTFAAPTIVQTTATKVIEGKTLEDIAYGEFTSRMFGGAVSGFEAQDSAKGYNTKFTRAARGTLTKVVVEFQVWSSPYVKCVVVEFTDDGTDIYAKVLKARYQQNGTLGYVFYDGGSTYYGNNSDIATAIGGSGYGVCDIRVAVGDATTDWTLDADANWSTLRDGATLDGDSVVRIRVTGENPTLTIDENVDVSRIWFVGNSGATLSISAGKTVEAENITGLGQIGVASGATLYLEGEAGAGTILNSGTVVKTGDGTVSWPFSNDSTGTTIVSNGTLKVASKSGTGTSNPTHTVRVASGATFDVNGVQNLTISVVLEDGAFFVNTGSAIGNTTFQTVNISLEGDATVTAGKNFGLMAPGWNQTGIALGSNTLTFNGTAGFWLVNTTMTGDGTINVESGTLQCARASSTGANCTLNIGASGALRIDGTMTLCVSNFYNSGKLRNGTDFGGTAYGTLLVNGTLTTGNAMTNITLAAGATVKATGTAQVVSGTFSASGTVTIDASEIAAETLRAGDVAVLTVPAAFNPSGITWNVSGAPVAGTRAKWIDNGDGTSTLYVAKPTGLMVVFR